MRSAQGEHRALGERVGAQAGEQIGGAAAEDRLGVDAPGEGEVGAQPVGGRTRVQDGARRDTYRGAPGGGAAVDGHRAGRAGDRDGGGRADPYGTAREGGLQGGGGPGVAGQAVGQAVRGRVQGAGARHTEVGMAGPAEVLDGGERTGPDDREGAVGHQVASCGTKRTRVPGASSAAGSRRGSHSTVSVVPISCQPPGEERG